MKSKKSSLIFLVIVTVLIIVFIARNVPSNPPPKQETTQNNQLEEKNWEIYEFPEVGLTFSAPFEMRVNGEKVDDSTFTLYVQRSDYSAGEEYYQLYGLYNLSAGTVNKEDLKSGFNEDSIEETIVGGFPAVSGQNKGERNRFVTYVITDRGLFMLATSQPTLENKKLTSEIIETFDLR